MQVLLIWPALRRCFLAPYVPLPISGSESVPALSQPFPDNVRYQKTPGLQLGHVFTKDKEITKMARFISVEIDSAQLRVAEMDRAGKRERIVQCFNIPLAPGIVEDGEVRDTKNLADILVESLEAHNVKTRRVYYVAGSSRIASRRIQIPVVKKNKIQGILEENGTEYFPVDISKYVLSYTIMGELKESADGTAMAAPQYDLLAYVAPKTISIACQEMSDNAGLNMIGIGYVGDSIYQAVRGMYGQGLHLLAKIEMGHTVISIVKDGDLALQRSINYGVDAAIEVMMNEPVFGEPANEWHALDILCGRNCIHSRLEMENVENMPAMAAARAEVTESFRYLIGNISRIMDYYISRNLGAAFDSIELCGLGAGVKGIADLFSYELAQSVRVLDALPGQPMPAMEGGDSMYRYIALAAPSVSGLNLMERVTRQKKNQVESLKGATIICIIGVAAGLILSAVGIGNHLYQYYTGKSLEKQIAAMHSVQELYDTYVTAKSKTESFDKLYAYTVTPNESLRTFLEEMEEKVPSDLVITNFTANGTEVSFQFTVNDKNEAAKLLTQMRTFESLSDVTTSGLEESDNGEVTMLVVGTYAQPAVINSSAQ